GRALLEVALPGTEGCFEVLRILGRLRRLGGPDALAPRLPLALLDLGQLGRKSRLERGGGPFTLVDPALALRGLRLRRPESLLALGECRDFDLARVELPCALIQRAPELSQPLFF